MSSALIDLLKDIPLSTVLKEKVASFEAKASELETERDILQSKLRNSQSEIDKMKREVHDLRQRLTAAMAPPEKPHEKAEKILKLFAEHTQPRLSINSVFPHTGLSRVENEYYWAELKSQKFIGTEGCNPPFHSLTQKGRKYVMDHLS